MPEEKTKQTNKHTDILGIKLANEEGDRGTREGLAYFALIGPANYALHQHIGQTNMLVQATGRT